MLLLEALVAVALLSSVIVAGLVSLSFAAAKDSERRSRVWLTEYARSKSEEYIATYPQVSFSGTEEGGWAWQIDEKVVRPDGTGPFDDQIVLIEISIRVWNENASETTVSGTTLMARRP